MTSIDKHTEPFILLFTILDIGGDHQRIAVNSSVVGDDLVDGDYSSVLRDSHHFDARLETRAFFLVDHIDFNGVGFGDYTTSCTPARAKVVLCFVGDGYAQVEHLQLFVVQRL